MSFRARRRCMVGRSQCRRSQGKLRGDRGRQRVRRRCCRLPAGPGWPCRSRVQGRSGDLSEARETDERVPEGYASAGYASPRRTDRPRGRPRNYVPTCDGQPHTLSIRVPTTTGTAVPDRKRPSDYLCGRRGGRQRVPRGRSEDNPDRELAARRQPLWRGNPLGDRPRRPGMAFSAPSIP